MFQALLGMKKYYKCSYCKLLDSMNPLNKLTICDKCHQPLKEISEMEYKQKIELSKKIKEERRKYLEEYNKRNEKRNNSSLHSSNIQFNNNDNDVNININNNHININNNVNLNQNNNQNHRQRVHIKIIKSGNGQQNIIRIGGRENSSERNQTVSHRNNNMIIFHNISNTNNNNNQNSNRNNNNINIININSNSNRNNQNEIIQINRNQNQRNPFRIMVQRHHISNDVFDPNFSIFGSTFNHIFQENFASNFRSNFRGNFINEIINLVERNRAEVNRSRNNPISEQNMQKLKKFILNEKYCKKEKNGKIEKPNCCICLEEIELGKETVLLPCGHMFHSDCCLTWLKKSNTCPICRFEIK